MSKMLKDVQKDAGGLGKSFQDVGKIAAGVFTGQAAMNLAATGFQKVTGFIGDSITAASDLGESMNAVNKIFGDSQKKIIEWGDKTANSFGLSQREFNQLVVPLGAGLKNAGLDMDTVASKSILLTERAADMASVFNTDVGTALEAIQAGLRGEADPLEKFGVGLSAAKVEAHALAMTGKDVAKSLTEQELALARVDLIMQQSASTQGDFASTSGELANATRIQQAKMEELQATIGEKLIPVQLAITQAKMAMVDLLVTKVIPVLEELYAKHWPAVSKAIGDTVAFVQTNWPLIQPVIEFAVTYVKTQIEGMIQIIRGVVEVVTSTVALVKAVFHGDWATAWEELKDIAGGVMDILLGNLKRMFGSIPGIALEEVKNLYAAGVSLIEGFINGIVQKAKDIPGMIKSNVVDPLVDALEGLFIIHSPSLVMARLGSQVSEGFGVGIVDGAGRYVVPAMKELGRTVESQPFDPAKAEGWGYALTQSMAKGITAGTGLVAGAMAAIVNTMPVTNMNFGPESSGGPSAAPSAPVNRKSLSVGGSGSGSVSLGGGGGSGGLSSAGMGPNDYIVGGYRPDGSMYAGLNSRGQLQYPNGQMASYAQGTSFVPNDGLAFLHRGEAVVPANQNRGGVTINFNAPVYGMADFEQKVAEAVRTRALGGGFSGVLATS